MNLHQFILFWSLMAAVTGFITPSTDSVKFGPRPPLKWIVEKTSTLRVAGKSNVNEFNCDIAGYYQPDTIFCTDDGGSGSAVKLSGCLEIEVFKFDCHSRMITNDLRKTLKAENHPKLIIRFLSLDRVPALSNNTQNMKGWVEVELAGIRKVFQVSYEFVNKGSSIFLLNGTRVFCFSDFKLTAPRKLGGAIQIKDEFRVDFKLKLNGID
jgi:hypothetical protein